MGLSSSHSSSPEECNFTAVIVLRSRENLLTLFQPDFAALVGFVLVLMIPVLMTEDRIVYLLRLIFFHPR